MVTRRREVRVPPLSILHLATCLIVLILNSIGRKKEDHDVEGNETSDWNRYAAEEYELLVVEEGAVEQQDDLIYDEDYEQEEDELVANLESLEFENDGLVSGADNQRSVLTKGNSASVNSDDDYADYAESDDYQY